MATRIYLPSTGAAPISPAFGGGGAWGVTAGCDRLKAVTAKISSSMATKSSNGDGVGTSSLGSLSHLIRQYVYGPIGAQTFSGTITGQIRGSESATSNNQRPCLTIYVVDSVGTTVRGTVFANSDTEVANPTSEWTTSLVNRKYPWSSESPATAAAIVASNNDYLVIEIGANKINTAITNRFVSGSFGDNSGTDLAVDETTTTANNPWVEFTMTIADASAAVDLPVLVMAPPIPS